MRNSAVKRDRPLREAAGDPCSVNPMVSDITVIRTAGTGVLVYSSSANELEFQVLIRQTCA
ncbi:MAG: hypothetical protein FWE94_04455 [Coriobacteriia bacterium]|nr:hypothetical protein [Coriobacteriia bacterium]